MEVGLTLEPEEATLAASDILDRVDTPRAASVRTGPATAERGHSGSPPLGTREPPVPHAQAEGADVGGPAVVATASGEPCSCPEAGAPAVGSLALPHEGERWARVRSWVAELPAFAGYRARTQETPGWTLDEAFASFCLDRIEETLSPTLAKPTKPVQAKPATRRKGQPVKFEGSKQTEPEGGAPPRLSRRRRSREGAVGSVGRTRLGLEEEAPEDKSEEDNDLAMDDNPNDLDYLPVPVVPYPKRRKSLPRAINSAKPSPKPAPGWKKTQRVAAQPPSEKAAAPKRAARPAKQGPAREALGPPRKRGRPRKPVTEDKKKAPKARVKGDKPTKQYVRVEVRLQRLPKMYECKQCRQHFPEPEEFRQHFLGAHQPEGPLPQPQDLGADEEPGAAQDPGTEEPARPGALLPDITHQANLLRQCPKCKEFVGDVTAHRRARHRRRDFICEECGKGFTENQILQKHRRVHEMDRTGQRYACTLCDKSYRFAQNLRSHLARHSGHKTFICHQCGKSFYTNNRLIIHAAVHLDEKPFKCSECGRGFSQKSNMQKHQRVHTGVRPYSCNLCSESFNHKVSLKNHQKKRHNIDWWKEAGRARSASPKRPASDATTASEDRAAGVAAATAVPATLSALSPPPQNAPPVAESHWRSSEMPHQPQAQADHWGEAGQQQLPQDNGGSAGQQPAPGDLEVPSQAPWPRPDGSHLEPAPTPSQSGQVETVQLQTLQPAGGALWKQGAGVPAVDRQGQAGDQGMAAFLYPTTYLQGYTPGYSGLPVIPVTTDNTILPTSRPY